MLDTHAFYMAHIYRIPIYLSVLVAIVMKFQISIVLSYAVFAQHVLDILLP